MSMLIINVIIIIDHSLITDIDDTLKRASKLASRRVNLTKQPTTVLDRFERRSLFDIDYGCSG